MKFLHTADWQMGMRARHVGEAAEAVRAARLEAARRTVQLAREHAAEFIVVAGDTFEHHGVERVLVQRVADILGAFPGPVFIIPGNHDPCVPGSVWEHPAWSSHPHLRVLTVEEPVALAWGTLFPCPLREKESPRDPTRWIDAAPRLPGFRIGLAHGTVAGVPAPEPVFPIARDAAARAGLDYLALGHWHSFAPYPDTGGVARMAYAGTHETSKFGERDSGHAVLVEIAEPGAAPVLTSLPTGGLRWETFEEELAEPGDLRRVREKIEALGEPAASLVDLRLRGLLSPDEAAELPRLADLLGARFLHGRLDSTALRPRPGDTRWIDRLPPGPVQAAATRLGLLADPHFTGIRPAGATPETAAQSLLLLYGMAGVESPADPAAALLP